MEQRTSFEYTHDNFINNVLKAIKRLKTLSEMQNSGETSSHVSSRSFKKFRSSEIAREMAKAYAAKMSLTKQKAELKKRQTLLNQQHELGTASAKANAAFQKVEKHAALDLLSIQQKVTEAEAEANYLSSFDGY